VEEDMSAAASPLTGGGRVSSPAGETPPAGGCDAQPNTHRAGISGNHQALRRSGILCPLSVFDFLCLPFKLSGSLVTMFSSILHNKGISQTQNPGSSVSSTDQ
jgi:hypothetical protein